MKYNIPFILIIIMSVANSCKKGFLDTPPVTDITRQDYITNLSTCNEYLNGIYIDLSEKFFSAHGSIYADIVSDNIKTPTGAAGFLNQYNWNQIANETNKYGAGSADENMNGYWVSGFRAIRACNYLLEKTEEFKQEDVAKAGIIRGQSLAIRALIYHYLINVFAQPYNFSTGATHPGIPYIKSYDYTLPAKRETVAENYDDLINDISEAVKLIPASNNNKNFIGHYAAKAIMAKILFYKGDFLNAKNIAREVSTAVPIMSRSNYPAKLFTAQESEAIFQIAPNVTASYNTSFASLYFRRAILYVCSKKLTDLLKENPNDVRQQWITLNGGNYQIIKFPINVVPGFSEPSLSYYNTIIRSSELYLTTAECYAQLGNMDSARYYLDAIRIRANTNAAITIASGKPLIDSIIKERQKELCFENNRMFDLLRTGNGVSRTDPDIPPSARSLSYPHPKAIAPIPVIDVMYYGISQNQSY